MIIIAGSLHFDAAERDAYLARVAGVAVAARSTPGCLDFVQTADPVDPTRINVYERWECDEDVAAFRNAGSKDDGADLPEIVGAEVAKYRIASVEAP